MDELPIIGVDTLVPVLDLAGTFVFALSDLFIPPRS